ncbi:MAG UNVERIFIED_CONTAM: sulfatase-like hydrolase/transferase [Planctomycetaceae bacterium]
MVVVFADDWGHFASAYGRLRPGTINDVVQTPNFDRLAKSGVLFTNAFVNAPSCTPCRSSLLSGQYFWRTGRGAILQGAVWDEKIPSFPLLLEECGYRLGSNGKVWSPGTPANAPNRHAGQPSIQLEDVSMIFLRSWRSLRIPRRLRHSCWKR